MHESCDVRFAQLQMYVLQSSLRFDLRKYHIMSMECQ